MTSGRLKGRDKIDLKVGEKLGKHRMGKHFDLEIEDHRFAFAVNHDSLAAEPAMDGIYVIRTSVKEEELSAADTVSPYKNLSEVEKASRTQKSIDLQSGPPTTTDPTG